MPVLQNLALKALRDEGPESECTDSVNGSASLEFGSGVRSSRTLALLEDVAPLLLKGIRGTWPQEGVAPAIFRTSASGVLTAVTHHSLNVFASRLSRAALLWQVGAVGWLQDENGYLIHPVRCPTRSFFTEKRGKNGFGSWPFLYKRGFGEERICLSDSSKSVFFPTPTQPHVCM